MLVSRIPEKTLSRVSVMLASAMGDFRVATESVQRLNCQE
jgi:hypothetical protein